MEWKSIEQLAYLLVSFFARLGVTVHGMEGSPQTQEIIGTRLVYFREKTLYCM